MLKISDITFADLPMLFAISGGVDSMVLLDAALKKLPKNHIFVAHFNHNLRGEESDGDEIFVKNYCEYYIKRKVLQIIFLIRLLPYDKVLHLRLKW